MGFDVSVIVPSYNRADLIPQTIHSILNQSHPPAEVIVVDDGSTDDTETVLQQFGSAIKYLRINNAGQARARNIGAEASTSEWIAFCDSDDLWQPNKLSDQVRLFGEGTGCRVFFHQLSNCSERAMVARNQVRFFAGRVLGPSQTRRRARTLCRRCTIIQAFVDVSADFPIDDYDEKDFF